MGQVYEATHARLAGRYAIKFLLKKLSDRPDATALFEREARITSSLQHPNIVQVVDFNVADLFVEPTPAIQDKTRRRRPRVDSVVVS